MEFSVVGTPLAGAIGHNFTNGGNYGQGGGGFGSGVSLTGYYCF